MVESGEEGRVGGRHRAGIIQEKRAGKESGAGKTRCGEAAELWLFFFLCFCFFS